jgi:hypothetical protein
MRKITEQITRAFLAREKRTQGNTHTDGTVLYLHGNAIARHTEDGLEVTNAGWFTVTTKERLNALPNVSINQSRGLWYLNGMQWNGEWTNVQSWTGYTADKDAPVFEYELQGDYGGGFERIETVDTKKEADELLQCYHINELQYRHRVVKKLVTPETV